MSAAIRRLTQVASAKEREIKMSNKNPMSRSRKQRPKTGNDVIDQIHHMLERFDQRLTLTNLRLVERYMEMELHFLIEFGIRGRNEKFIAYLERFADPGEVATRIVLKDSLKVNQSPQWDGVIQPEAGSTVLDNGGDQQAVFVDVVKLAEAPEQVIPTFVRFDLMDSGYGLRGDSLYFSLHAGFVFRDIIENWVLRKNLVKGAF
jgi:hypothetical protein